MENPENITGKGQTDSPSRVAQPGSMNDAALVRSAAVEAIRNCPKSRIQIVEEMSRLTGRRITKRMLDGWTAESRDDHRWPAEVMRAFCSATGSDRLLRVLPEAAGLRVITEQESDLLELGRSYLQRKLAERNMGALEQRLKHRFVSSLATLGRK